MIASTLRSYASMASIGLNALETDLDVEADSVPCLQARKAVFLAKFLGCHTRRLYTGRNFISGRYGNVACYSTVFIGTRV